MGCSHAMIGKFDISVHPRTTDGKPIENVKLSLPMPKSTLSVNATCNSGQYMYDPVSKVKCLIVSPIAGSADDVLSIVVYQVGYRQNSTTGSGTYAFRHIPKQVSD